MKTFCFWIFFMWFISTLPPQKPTWYSFSPVFWHFVFNKYILKVKVAQSCLTLCDSMDYWEFSRSEYWRGSLSLLQGIFPTQGLNPGLLHCRWILYQLSHKGSPRVLEWIAYPFSSGSSRPRNRTGVSCIAGGFFTNELSGKPWTMSSVQSFSRVWLFETPWIAACQASLSITNSWSLLKLMLIDLVMPSNHLIFCWWSPSTSCKMLG